MSLISEYINNKFGSSELEKELLRLVGKYNNLRNTCLLVYAASAEKQIPLVPLIQSDFYTIRDLLSSQTQSHDTVDVYLETPGGRGETAEEIVRFLHSTFKKVTFVVSGEAKSAGTIMVLGGNEILMTDTGSLGPIDAQIQVGRSVVSARDYIEWVEDKRKKATKDKMLNPFDATIVAQITPGELNHALHALEFAKDLVVEWLPQYKFADWQVTETRGLPVTDTMKRQHARKIANGLINRTRWRTHGRSIKIQDLESDEIGLKVDVHIDDKPELADIVYRIQTVCRLLFDSTTVFKIFATDQHKIFRQATPITNRPMVVPPQPGAVNIEQKCPKCGKNYRIYAKLADDPNIDRVCKEKGLTQFPKEGKIICSCGFEIDLLGIKNQIEIETGLKLITD
jgi:uncharacterized protein YggU (UPF0235/DUF167 family)